MNQIEAYAVRIVTEYATGGVEDDLDEDGEFDSSEEHESAVDLALLITRGMRAHPERVLEFAREFRENLTRCVT